MTAGVIPVKSSEGRRRMRIRAAQACRPARRFGDHTLRCLQHGRPFPGVSKYQRCGTRAVETVLA